MTIGICSDHAGYEYKAELIKYLARRGHNVIDYGTDSAASVDYADFAHPLARAVERGTVERGIAICGTGNGMAMTLNHHKGIRAGLAWNKEVATLVKEHNDANVLVMPARFATLTMCKIMVKAWMETEFAGGRHKRRIDKISVKR